MLLEGKVVIVSGVGPGLGRDLVLACARHGADVALVARNADRLLAIEREVSGPGRTLCVPADVATENGAGLVARAVLEKFGRIDGLVNNAAVIPPFQAVHEQPLEDVRQSMDANFYTALHLSRAAIPAMKRQGGGSIVMVGSAVVRHPKPRFGAYNIGKHATLGLMRSLALELGPEGIRVNTLAPGKIAGERLDRFMQMRAAELKISVEAFQENYVSDIALRRLPAAAEYADIAVFLLSSMSRAITGHLLDATGGEYF